MNTGSVARVAGVLVWAYSEMQEKSKCYQQIGTHLPGLLPPPLDTGGGTP
jgi:hypothetical protein